MKGALLGSFREPLLNIRYSTIGPPVRTAHVLPQTTRACAAPTGGPIVAHRMRKDDSLKLPIFVFLLPISTYVWALPKAKGEDT